MKCRWRVVGTSVNSMAILLRDYYTQAEGIVEDPSMKEWNKALYELKPYKWPWRDDGRVRITKVGLTPKPL